MLLFISSPCIQHELTAVELLAAMLPTAALAWVGVTAALEAYLAVLYP
jgi:hypothetical protein